MMLGTTKRNVVIMGVLACSGIGGFYLYLNGTTSLPKQELYTLPTLPYDFNALEPYIDAETMRVHYTKYHQSHVDKLNVALKHHDNVRHKPLEYLLKHPDEVPEIIRAAVQDQGGAHYNHSFFWRCMTPQSTKHPIGRVKALIESTYKTFEHFCTFLDIFMKYFNLEAIFPLTFK